MILDEMRPYFIKFFLTWFCAGSSNYNPLFFFPYQLNGTPVNMVFTSVAGHLMELDFVEGFKKWYSCSPLELYEAPVVKMVPQVGAGSLHLVVFFWSAVCGQVVSGPICLFNGQDKKPIEQNLREQARQCQWLILWLDCDREGENIAFEVRELSTG
jgi:DNA topoisomerase-3